MKDLRRMTLDSGEMRQSFVIETKSDRSRKRLRVRRLKYTCQTKINKEHGSGDRQSESTKVALNKEDKDVGKSTKILSVSFSATGNVKSYFGATGNVSDVVLSSSGDEIRKASESLYGVVSAMGRRQEMEDAVRAEVGFSVNGGRKYDFFGVYDGHGGPDVARACRDRLHKVVAEAVEREVEVEGREGGGSGKEIDWERVMEGCFGKMDEEVSGIAAARTLGSTAVVAVVTEEKVVVANCGDCRAVLSRGGVALPLSTDHKPDRVDELKRIEGAGGKVINWNGSRVLGVLATSRSIGDQYLRPYVISKPEVTVTNRSEKEDEFLILASDGLWDVISNEMACKVVNKCLRGRLSFRRISIHRQHHHHHNVLNYDEQSHTNTSEAAAVLAELAMARGSKDNISVIVVDLTKRKPSSS